MNVHGGNDVGAGLGQLLAARLSGALQVQSIGRDGRASGLDLPPEVLSLVYVELLAVGHVAENILLEANDLVLALLVVVIGCGRLRGVIGLEVVGGWVRDEAGGAVEATLHGGLNAGENRLG